MYNGAYGGRASELADTKAPTLNTTNVVKEKVGRGSSINLSSAYGAE